VIRNSPADTQNSIGPVARSAVLRRRRAGFARLLPLLPLVAGAVLLAVAEPLRLRSVEANGRAVGSVTAGAHHGWALAVIAVALLAFAALIAARGSFPAAAGAVVLAAVALAIVLVVDRPALDDTGLVAGRLGSAVAGPAFRLELVGAVLALVGSVASAVAERRH
jgi:hypothetical protein